MTLSTDLTRRSRYALRSLDRFVRRGTRLRLRPYQLAPVPSILRSIDEGLGLSIAILFPRQSGKDELMANLKAYLMVLFSPRESSIVEVNPTYEPQTSNAMLRLEKRLTMNPMSHGRWKHSGFTIQMGQCRTSFLSGDGQANVVGATASLLLIVNEAQDIEPAIYDRKFAPMCASTNATRIFCGTAWTSATLLAREVRQARLAQERDGLQRLFMVDAGEVARIHPPYGRHVAAQVAALGRQNPIVRTQYFNEEIDAQSGMFTAARLALIQPDRPPLDSPHLFDASRGSRRETYAFLVDAAGQDEARLHDPEAALLNPGRDAVTLSIVEVDLSTLETLRTPTYRVVQRHSWSGLNHLAVFGRLKALGETWCPLHIVVDATGAGEGLWALLDRAFPTRVLPVKFSRQVKSDLGWRFLAIIETGRFRDCAPCEAAARQYAACQCEILPGQEKILRWGVPQGARSPDGGLIHDDHLMADALVAVLDRQSWSVPYQPFSIIPPDPLG